MGLLNQEGREQAVIFLDNFDETYSSMIAGALPSSDGALGPLMLVIRDILGTEDVHLCSHFDTLHRRIYYFAAASRAMHSVGKMNLPLVAAIPGKPGHRGNGAYVITQGANAAAAIFSDGELRLFCNSVDAVDEAIRETGLATYHVAELEGEAFEALRGKYRRVGEGLTRQALSIYGVLALFTGVGYVGMSAATGYFERARTDDLEQRQRSVERLASSISFVSPVHERLARIQSISEVVVRSGGWVESYDFTDGKESFKLMLPEWVTNDHYAKLGGDVTAESEGDGMVAVVKVAKGAGGKPITPRPSAEQKAPDGTQKPPADAAATSGTAPPQANSAQGSLVPQAGAAGAAGGAGAGAPAAAEDPKMPAQAPFGSAASRPPSSHGHAH